MAKLTKFANSLIVVAAQFFGFYCAHRNTSRAFRGKDGSDYVRCLDCGEGLKSKIQFG